MEKEANLSGKGPFTLHGRDKNNDTVPIQLHNDITDIIDVDAVINVWRPV